VTADGYYFHLYITYSPPRCRRGWGTFGERKKKIINEIGRICHIKRKEVQRKGRRGIIKEVMASKRKKWK
jgi:hypothetical protein